MAARELGFHNQSESSTKSSIVTIDVGGKLFQTTKKTLAMAKPNSLIARVSESPNSFIDRDPELFSVLLSLLRTGRLNFRAKAFDFQDLIFESQFYGIEDLLIDSVSNPSRFEALSLEKSSVLALNGRDSPSAIATTELGSVHVAHGSKITSFDWSLRRKRTILSRFSAVDSILALSPAIAAAGATDFSGLQIIDLETGLVRSALSWENATRSDSTVQAIGHGRELLFASFESGRRNSNTIMIYDSKTLSVFGEIGQNEIYGAEIGFAFPASKLIWIETLGLLMASGSHSGPSGVKGSLKFFDVRAQKSLVFEIQDTFDCFADVTVTEDSPALIFKVGVNSGEVSFADLRSFESSPWICLGDERKVFGGKKEGLGCKIECRGRQVFCANGGDIELWSEVSSEFDNSGSEEREFRKNSIGKSMENNNGGFEKITNLGFGGNKMFVTRKDKQCVEVWQNSSHRLF